MNRDTRTIRFAEIPGRLRHFKDVPCAFNCSMTRVRPNTAANMIGAMSRRCRLRCPRRDLSSAKGQRLREVGAIEVHDFVPSGDEVVDELLLRVRASINFGQVAELRI